METQLQKEMLELTETRVKAPALMKVDGEKQTRVRLQAQVLARAAAAELFCPPDHK